MLSNRAELVVLNQAVLKVLLPKPVVNPLDWVPAVLVISDVMPDHDPTLNPLIRRLISFSSNPPGCVSPSYAENRTSMRAIAPPK